MAGAVAGADDNRRQLIAAIRRAGRATWRLHGRCINAEACSVRLTLDETDELDIDTRIARGDCEAIHDAIVEEIAELGEVASQISLILADDGETLGRLLEVRRMSIAAGMPPVRRFKKQETAARDRSGKERQRSRMTRSMPASQG